MSETNPCERNCPKKAMNAVEYRCSRASGLLDTLAAHLTAGGRGLAQTAQELAVCPSRTMPDEQWVPAPSCMAAAQQQADNMKAPVKRSDLKAHERDVLAQIILPGE
jgi:hypothetical protein